MKKKYFITLFFIILIGIIVISLIGCGGNSFNKVCKLLTQTDKQITKAHLIAKISNEKDPNLFSDKDLYILEESKDTINAIKNIICDIKKE